MPAGTPHTFGNAGPEEARYRAEDRPALQSESFFETYFGLAQDGKVNPRTGLPNLLQLAVVLHHYRKEIVLVSPPPSGDCAATGRHIPIRTGIRHSVRRWLTVP